jgi:hypothetical protein
MEATLGTQICGVRFARCREVAEVLILAVNLNLSYKLSAVVQINTKESELVASARLAYVLPVLGIVSLPQIGDSVIVLYAIYVVDMGFREVTIDIQPGQAVGKVNVTVNHDLDIPTAMRSPGNITSLNAS